MFGIVRISIVIRIGVQKSNFLAQKDYYKTPIAYLVE